jgi:3-ketosteroid 9alpha-monooxygenase subunit A
VTERFPHPGYPTGWFQVAWSAEIDPGSVRPLRYFGQDLVLYRGEAGEAHILDAHCRHLGAHLGHGGKVCGDEIECPFHGWRWGPQGENTDIPYSSKPNRSQRLRAWPVREVNGFVLVWHDTQGREPTWEPPLLPEHEAGDRYDPYPECTVLWEGRRLHPQLIGENAVDAAHQKYVHGAAEVPTVVSFEDTGPCFHVRQRLVFGKAKASTWLTPDGELVAHANAEVWGIGLAIARFEGTDDATHVQTQTPVDENLCDLRATVFVRQEPGGPERPEGRALKRIQFEIRQVENDLPIWEHLRYVEHAPFAPEETRAFQAFRRWAAQFYPGTPDQTPTVDKPLSATTSGS